MARKDDDIAKADQIVRRLNSDKATRELAEIREKYLMDEISGQEGARAEGKAEGIKEATIKIARKLLVKGNSIEDIVEATGLTKEEVQQLEK